MAIIGIRKIGHGKEVNVGIRNSSFLPNLKCLLDTHVGYQLDHWIQKYINLGFWEDVED